MCLGNRVKRFGDRLNFFSLFCFNLKNIHCGGIWFLGLLNIPHSDYAVYSNYATAHMDDTTDHTEDTTAPIEAVIAQIAPVTIHIEVSAFHIDDTTSHIEDTKACTEDAAALMQIATSRI